MNARTAVGYIAPVVHKQTQRVPVARKSFAWSGSATKIEYQKDRYLRPVYATRPSAD